MQNKVYHILVVYLAKIWCWILHELYICRHADAVLSFVFISFPERAERLQCTESGSGQPAGQHGYRTTSEWFHQNMQIISPNYSHIAISQCCGWGGTSIKFWTHNKYPINQLFDHDFWWLNCNVCICLWQCFPLQELRNLLQASRKAEASSQEELATLARRMKEVGEGRL